MSEWKPAPGKRHFGALDRFCASRLPENKRDGFSVYAVEAVTGGVICTGNWPTRVKSRGASAGYPDYRSGGNSERVLVTMDEYRAALTAPVPA